VRSGPRPTSLPWPVAEAGRPAVVQGLRSRHGGLLSDCAFMLGPWESGPALHRHTAVDEALYILAG
jgi:hypothetical protein